MKETYTCSWFTALLVIGWLLLSGAAWAAEVGQPGGPCRSDKSCDKGSQCFVSPQGNICLLPGGTTGNSNSGNSSTTLKNCPPAQSYLSCQPDGGNCQLRCIYPKGFGCQSTPSASLWSLLTLLLILRLRKLYPT